MCTQSHRWCIAVLVTNLAACSKNTAGLPPASPTAEPASGVTRSARVVTVDATGVARVGAVDPRFSSYNVEMLEVTGGKFWKPYEDIAKLPPAKDEATTSSDVPAGMSADLYQYREPIDLANPRLRTLAAALGPAHGRGSGDGDCRAWAGRERGADRHGAARRSSRARRTSRLDRGARRRAQRAAGSGRSNSCARRLSQARARARSGRCRRRHHRTVAARPDAAVSARHHHPCRQ
jgi:hypothetical protein